MVRWFFWLCVVIAVAAGLFVLHGCASPRQMTDREGAAIAEWIKRK